MLYILLPAGTPVLQLVEGVRFWGLLPGGGGRRVAPFFIVNFGNGRSKFLSSHIAGFLTKNYQKF